MVAQARVNVHETIGRKNNSKLNFFSITWYEIMKKYTFLRKIADTSFKNYYLIHKSIIMVYFEVKEEQ